MSHRFGSFRSIVSRFCAIRQYSGRLTRSSSSSYYLRLPIESFNGRQPPSRFATSAAAAAAAEEDSALLRALKAEIEQGKDLKTPLGKAKKSLPKPFMLVDKPDAKEVVLRRSYEGEEISVCCRLQHGPFSTDDDEAVDMEEDGAIESVQMRVKITKGAEFPCLEIICITYGDDPIVVHISFTQNGDHKELPYEGPAFSDFDDDVKTGFHNYVLARGIDAQVGAFIVPYMYCREQQAYLKWLQNVESFIAK